jgi:nucleotide-binding universal stress UspA family protein
MEHSTDSRIVAGVDGSASSLSALRWAIRQAGLTGGAVDAIIAWHYLVATGGYGWAPAGLDEGYDFQESAEKTLTEAISNTLDPGSDVRVRPRVVEGDPARR